MRTLTKGNVIIEEIKVGDIHYEYELALNSCVKSEVLTLPVLENDIYTWKSKQISNGNIIVYSAHKDHAFQFLNLYNTPAYIVKYNL